MFKQLSRQMTAAFKHLSGQGTLSESNIQPALRAVKDALVDADVAMPVIRALLEDVKKRSLGQSVVGSLKPEDVFVRCVHDALVDLLSDEGGETIARLNQPGTTVILMVGLQGVGKTTTTAKLGTWLAKQKQKVMVVSADVYRPAAILQLKQVAEAQGLDVIGSDASETPVAIAKRALKEARQSHADVLIIDTAGRLHVDQDMMDEVRAIHGATDPAETLFVVDSMTGQDAAYTAQSFGDVLPLTGVVLTKTDGDSRGGAALSVKHITGRPIKFVGRGEKADDLDRFDPKRLADQILDMGDVVSLVEQVEAHVDEAQAKKALEKIQKGTFDFEDFLTQLQQMRNMGGIQSLMSKLPGANQLQDGLLDQALDESRFERWEVMIGSMTLQERRQPDLLQSSASELMGRSFGKRRKGKQKGGAGRESRSRLQRIARGSGCSMEDVQTLIRQFKQMQKMMDMMKGNKMMHLMSRMGGGQGFPWGS